ncbi:protocatechuate 3,4-dioxygenase subunit alpha [Bosea sp. Root483D1]|uniref:protocatechuate 3,4-dioxygenase subunit alpha n=1 Tax=Bosea sp. Root483D1 TaxID=1736544 RepID=UPI00070D357E|nr:protocatechuate 3,4-dioxygenase subunit alpha [Bosea sp. Root483D1]KRE21388.1 protocatechuate 3,4-dioxygenase subunit alpha [Bosea sp. Root483D1]
MNTEKPDGLTPSQTIGPFFAYALTPRAYGGPELASEQVAGEGVAGERIRIEGTVFDGDGVIVGDAMIETWQADAEGRFNAVGNAGFTGFGRAETTAEGAFFIETIRPGALPGPNGSTQAPHLTVSVFARGLLIRLATRIYFDDEPGNAQDPVLALVPAERRSTLIARRGTDGVFRFDIRLQGEGETVFFDV